MSLAAHAEIVKMGELLAKNELMSAITILDNLAYTPDQLAEAVKDAIYEATGERYQVQIYR